MDGSGVGESGNGGFITFGGTRRLVVVVKLLREVEVWMADVVLAMTVDDCSLRWRSESSE